METDSIGSSSSEGFFSKIFRKPVLLVLAITLVVLVIVFIFLGMGSLNNSNGEGSRGILGVSRGSQSSQGTGSDGEGIGSQESAIQDCVNRNSVSANCKSLVLEGDFDYLCDSTNDPDECYSYSADITQIADYCSYIDSESSRADCLQSIDLYGPLAGGLEYEQV